MLNDKQKEKALLIWEKYRLGEKRFLNASKEYTQTEVDIERKKVIPQIKSLIEELLDGKIELGDFKTTLDGINKQNRLWGFKGISGQMYFNVIFNVSVENNEADKLVDLIKECILIPETVEQAKEKIIKLEEFTILLSDYVLDKRGAPRISSIPYFLSYFWQIQSHCKWPIYYSSMINVFKDENLWEPKETYAENYGYFKEFNEYLKKLFKLEGVETYLWEIEHSFWMWKNSVTPIETVIVEKKKPKEETKIVNNQDLVISNSYIPPIVAILPALSKNDERLRKYCEDSGTDIVKLFEKRVAVLFEIMGYKVSELGQGKGRVPDGIAIDMEARYAIIFDTKIRQEHYSMGTDDRTIKEYINQELEPLRKQGVRKFYYAIISSVFKGDVSEQINGIKMETDISEVLLIETEALLALLEQKLRTPDLLLGPKGIQSIFTQSGILKKEDVIEKIG